MYPGGAVPGGNSALSFAPLPGAFAAQAAAQHQLQQQPLQQVRSWSGNSSYAISAPPPGLAAYGAWAASSGSPAQNMHPSPWTGTPQFFFDAKPRDQNAPAAAPTSAMTAPAATPTPAAAAVSSAAAAPMGWLPSDVAHKQAVREVEALRADSLFAEPLPHPLLVVPIRLAATQVNVPRAGKAQLQQPPRPPPYQREPAPPQSQQQQPLLAAGAGGSDGPAAVSSLSKQACSSQSLLPSSSSSATDVPSVAGFMRNFQTAWDAVMHSVEALSGGWCSHQGPAMHGASAYRGVLGGQLEFHPNGIPGQVEGRAWMARTVPPMSASAQRGGAQSPSVGFSAPEEEATSSGAAQSYSGLRNASGDRGLAPREVQEALHTGRWSMCSLKGNKNSSPNQDRGLCASLHGGAVGCLAVFDGHGEGGHVVADVACELLPKVFLRCLWRASHVASQHGAVPAIAAVGLDSLGLPGGGNLDSGGGAHIALGTGQSAPLQEAAGTAEWWREGAKAAFEDMHTFLSLCTAEFLAERAAEAAGVPPNSADSQGSSPGGGALPVRAALPRMDARTSGTTATIALLLPGQRLLVAHVGDSRAVFGARPRAAAGGPAAAWRVRDLTRDHKPDLPEEKARIQARGAQVVGVGSYPNTTHRVFTLQQTWPSINMSRSLGDLHAHTQGLSCIPDVGLTEPLWNPAEEDAVLVIGTDGIWDVVSPASAVELCAMALRQGTDPSAALAREAYDGWGRRGLQGNYSDDITAVVKFL